MESQSLREKIAFLWSGVTKRLSVWLDRKKPALQPIRIRKDEELQEEQRDEAP